MTPFFANNNVPGVSGLSTSRSTTLSVLDVGSSKICCMIAKLRPQNIIKGGEGQLLPGRSHSIEVLGFGHQRSRGIKSGVVQDMDEAEQAIRLAIDGAERSAGLTVDSLLLAVNAGRLGSDTYSSSIRLGGREVERGDVNDVLAAGHAHAKREDRSILHALPIGYTLDAEHGITDPVSMVGQELGVDMHVVSADSGPLRNLENCINRSHLSVDGMVAAPYAAGLAALVDDEARLGCACIDMGGGTTSVSIFLGGRLVFADAVALGGHHVTMDLARCLSTPVRDAERLKVLHGKAVHGQMDEAELVSISPMGDEPHVMPGQVSVATLSQIIRPRLEETFEFVRERINRSGFAGAIGNRFVLTGGASQLTEVNEVAARVFAANIRLGRPLGVSGLPKTAKGPAFAASAGLLIYPQISGAEYVARDSLSARILARTNGGGAFARMGRWLKESF
ncbi:MAG: cell division protein FtsA [Pseudomonadota bacterium]